MATSNPIDNIPPEKRGNPAWVKGGPSPNPGGRKRVIADIEAMLDAEHRTVENMREVFARLKALALDDVVRTFMDKRGEAHETIEPPDPAFMRMYLERTLGPVREHITDDDLRDAPPEVVEWLRSQPS